MLLFMDPGHWKQVERIFQACVARPEEQRSAFLEDACEGDPDLQEELRGLLAADARTLNFLGLTTPEAAEAAQDPVAGQRIGPYRMVRNLGSGGMGVVHLAERADGQFEQRVALKLIKIGLSTREAVARFQGERQILARLEHPNISRLLDGGVSADGQPYFTMEYVEGECIDSYCEGRKLSVRERLVLFQVVCSAVQFAHRNLVVHRDLKPGNILVTNDGTVKLLDFGIAKLTLDQEGGCEWTGTGQRPMTPAYASPEQIRGEAVSTASDVYSLGVILHELLTGQRDQLPRLLAGDLDNICGKALEKDPERRYASAENLKQDIQRHLDGLPILARPASLGYRTRKFLARNRMAASLSMTVLSVLVVLVTVFISRLADERDLARLEASKAREIAAFIQSLFEFSDPDLSRGDTVTARELLDRGAARIERELVNQPQIQATMMHVIGTVYQGLGLYPDAERLLRQALEIRKLVHGARHPEVARTLDALVQAVESQGRLHEAEEIAREALAMWRGMEGDHPSDLANALDDLASVLYEKADFAAAGVLYGEALSLRTDSLGAGHRDVATSLNNLAEILTAQGRYPDAEKMYEKALALNRKLLGEMHREVATNLSNLASVLHRQRRLDDAEERARQSLAIRRKVLGGDHPEVTTSLNTLGVILLDKGDLDAAEPFLRQALELRRKRLGAHHPHVAVPLTGLAALVFRKGDLIEAEKLFRESLALHRETLPQGHVNIAQPLLWLGRVMMARKRAAEAELFFQEALQIRRAGLPEGHPAVAQAQGLLGACLTGLARFKEAEPLLTGCYETTRARTGAASRSTCRALERLIALYKGSGQATKARSFEERLAHAMQ